MLLPSIACCEAVQNIVEELVPPRRLRPEPLVRPEHPWEAKGVYYQGSVLKDGDVFRMWYSAIGERRREQQYLAYAESRDGLAFRKPLRREWPLGDWPETNVLYGRRFNISAPNVHFYNEPRDGYRYFLTFDSRMDQHRDQSGLTWADRRRYMRHPNFTPDFDWDRFFPPNPMLGRATYVADSVDGFRWEPEDARCAVPGMSDGDHTVAWDPVRRLYRMYFRHNRVDENGRRIRQVVVSTSPDTVDWSEPVLCMESDAIDDPRVNQIHGLTVTYRDGLFIGLVQMMEIEEEVVRWNPLTPFERARFHVQLAVSLDGLRFHRVADRAEYFGTGDEGAFDAGMVRSGGQWAFDGDRMLMYYDGRPYRHAPKDPEKTGLPADGCSTLVGIGAAEAPRDRFAGLVPRDPLKPAHVVLRLPAGARRLALNADIRPGASITASVRRPDGCRVLTHTDERCVALREGGLRLPLQWDSGPDMPPGPGPLCIRLRLCGRAAAYALYPDTA